MLTGRNDQMGSMRQLGGLSGFPRREESVYDAFGTAHSSTSISAAFGMAMAAQQMGSQRKAVAIIGDGDIRDSGMGFNARILGWLNQGWSIAEYRHQYATSFGQGGGESDYSMVLFEISFGTSAWAAVWRLLLPLVVLMSMVLLVFKVRPDEQDARASIPVTVLLTLVFLQQTYRSDLPVLPFLTFLDQVYVVAYVVTLVAFVLVIWIGRRYADVEEIEDIECRELAKSRLEHLDSSWPVVVVIFSTIAIAVAWFSIPPGA